MLAAELSDGVVSGEARARLHRFRSDNGISQEQHETLVLSLNWTLREYFEGERNSAKDKIDGRGTTTEGFKWLFRSAPVPRKS